MRSQASPWYNTQYAPLQYEGDINSFISYGDKVNEHWERPRTVLAKATRHTMKKAHRGRVYKDIPLSGLCEQEPAADLATESNRHCARARDRTVEASSLTLRSRVEGGPLAIHHLADLRPCAFTCLPLVFLSSCVICVVVPTPWGSSWGRACGLTGVGAGPPRGETRGGSGLQKPYTLH